MNSRYLQERGYKRKRTQTKVSYSNKFYGFDKNGKKNKYHGYKDTYDRGFDGSAVGKGLEEEEEEDRNIAREMRNKKITKQGYVEDDFIESDDESEEECSDDESEEECSDDESEEECSDDESEEECSDEESDEEYSDEESEEESKLININVYNVFINRRKK